MKTKAKVPEGKAVTQPSPPKEPALSTEKLRAEVSSLCEGFTKIHFELWEVVGPVSLVSHALLQHGGSEDLVAINEDGVRNTFTSLGMASADILEVYASKIYVICNCLEHFYK